MFFFLKRLYPQIIPSWEDGYSLQRTDVGVDTMGWLVFGKVSVKNILRLSLAPMQCSIHPLTHSSLFQTGSMQGWRGQRSTSIKMDSRLGQ